MYAALHFSICITLNYKMERYITPRHTTKHIKTPYTMLKLQLQLWQTITITMHDATPHSTTLEYHYSYNYTTLTTATSTTTTKIATTIFDTTLHCGMLEIQFQVPLQLQLQPRDPTRPHTTLHYTTVHYPMLHYSRPDYTTLSTAKSATTLHDTGLHQLQYPPLH